MEDNVEEKILCKDQKKHPRHDILGFPDKIDVDHMGKPNYDKLMNES